MKVLALTLSLFLMPAVVLGAGPEDGAYWLTNTPLIFTVTSWDNGRMVVVILDYARYTFEAFGGSVSGRTFNSTSHCDVFGRDPSTSLSIDFSRQRAVVRSPRGTAPLFGVVKLGLHQEIQFEALPTVP